MNFEVNTLEDGTYLVYKVGANETVDRYALNTISSNNIDGVMKMNRENDNGVECFYINITAKYPLKMMLEKPVRREFLLGVFESIAKISRDADDYLLDPKYFLFNYDNMYYDLTEKKLSLIYLPIEREEEEIDVKKFLKNMLFDLTYDTRENCYYVAYLINLINSKETVTMDKLLEVIDDIRKRLVVVPAPTQKTDEIRQQPVQPQASEPKVPQQIQPKQEIPVPAKPQEGKAVNVPSAPQKPAEPPKKGLFGGLLSGRDKSKEKVKKEKPAVKNAIPIPGMPEVPTPNTPQMPGGKVAIPTPGKKNTPQPAVSETPNVVTPPVNQAVNVPNNTSGHTVIIGGAAQTGRTVFKKDIQQGNGVAQLTRVSTNETATIKGSLFKIGKEKSFVDFYVSGNPTVSRIHAQIRSENGNYFIEDINSTNHTYLGSDTTPLQAGQLYPLQSGMRFRISDEEFLFKIN